jgi:hypothetical protein
MGPAKIEGATARQRLRPLALGRKVFEALRLNLCERVDLAIFPGKRNLQVSLCKAVHGCAKTPFEKPSFLPGAGAPRKGRLVKIRAVKVYATAEAATKTGARRKPRKRQGSTLGLGSFWESREKRLTPVFDARPDRLQVPLEATTKQNRARLIENRRKECPQLPRPRRRRIPCGFGLADKKDSVRSEAWKIASDGFATLERPDARGRPALEVTGS